MIITAERHLTVTDAAAARDAARGHGEARILRHQAGPTGLLYLGFTGDGVAAMVAIRAALADRGVAAAVQWESLDGALWSLQPGTAEPVLLTEPRRTVDDVLADAREGIRGEADGTSINVPVEDIRMLLDAIEGAPRERQLAVAEEELQRATEAGFTAAVSGGQLLTADGIRAAAERLLRRIADC